jgi:hypothetical protein
VAQPFEGQYCDYPEPTPSPDVLRQATDPSHSTPAGLVLTLGSLPPPPEQRSPGPRKCLVLSFTYLVSGPTLPVVIFRGY